MQFIISQEDVARDIASADKHVVILDCRFVLGQPDAGHEQYEIDHIAGAFYVDLEKDLSGVKRAHGGRHPIPDLGEFSIRMSQLGVDHATRVIAYDDQGGAMASRLWWMLQFLGHTQVYVLDQGYRSWKQSSRPISADKPTASPRIFSPIVMRHWLASYEEVNQKMNQVGVILVDSRESSRYQGIEEQIDPTAGHIPGAQNYYWKDVLNEQGSWKSPEELSMQFQALQDKEEIIVYCGSGVTACANVLSMKRAGFQQVKLYSGSWSDWVSYADSPIALGEG